MAQSGISGDDSPSGDDPGQSRSRGRQLSRRALLVTGGGVVAAAAIVGGGYSLVEAGTLPGKYRLAPLLGQCGSAPAVPAGPQPARHQVSFYSAYRQCEVTMVTLIPAGVTSTRGLGVVIALHGMGGDAAGTATTVSQFMPSPEIPRAIARRFAVITVDGGTTYWHKRADGDDPQGMILHEVLPRAAAIGLETTRPGIVGDSMGGYGALLLAERLGAARGAVKAAAVAGIKPAIFASYADANRADGRSFDSAADFARNNVFTGIGALEAVPVYVAVGQSDPFEPVDARFRSRLTQLKGHPPAGGVMEGCHDEAFWTRNLPPALTFIGHQLAPESKGQAHGR